MMVLALEKLLDFCLTVSIGQSATAAAPATSIDDPDADPEADPMVTPRRPKESSPTSIQLGHIDPISILKPLISVCLDLIQSPSASAKGGEQSVSSAQAQMDVDEGDQDHSGDGVDAGVDEGAEERQLEAQEGYDRKILSYLQRALQLLPVNTTTGLTMSDHHQQVAEDAQWFGSVGE